MANDAAGSDGRGAACLAVFLWRAYLVVPCGAHAGFLSFFKGLFLTIAGVLILMGTEK